MKRFYVILLFLALSFQAALAMDPTGRGSSNQFKITDSRLELESRLLPIVNARGEGGMTPAMVAAFEGDDQALRGLILARADLKAVNDEGRTAMHYAKNATIVSTLDKADDSLKNVRDNAGRTPAMIFVAGDGFQGRDNEQPLQTLISRGADLTIRDAAGMTVMHYAKTGKIVRILDKADGSLKNVRDNKGLTPAMKFARDGELDALQALINRGVDPAIRDNVGRTAMHYAKTPEIVNILDGANKTLKNMPDFAGITPAMKFAELGNADALRALIAKKVDLQARDIVGWSAMHLAKTSEIVRILDAADSSLKDAPDIIGRGPVRWFANHGSKITIKYRESPDEVEYYLAVKEVFDALVSVGANLESTDIFFDNIMFSEQAPQTLKYLIKNKPNLLKGRNWAGWTPLMKLLFIKDHNVGMLLKQAKKEDFTAKDLRGRSLIHFVRTSEHLRLLEETAKALGVTLDLNATDNEGRTLLSWIVLNESGGEDDITSNESGFKEKLFRDARVKKDIKTKHGFDLSDLFRYTHTSVTEIAEEILEGVKPNSSSPSKSWNAISRHKLLYAFDDCSGAFKLAMFKSMNYQTPEAKSFWFENDDKNTAKRLWKDAAEKNWIVMGEHLNVYDYYREPGTNALKRLSLIQDFNPPEGDPIANRFNALRTKVLTTGGVWGFREEAAKGAELKGLFEVASNIGRYKMSKYSDGQHQKFLDDLAKDFILDVKASPKITRHQTIGFVIAATKAFDGGHMMPGIVSAANERLKKIKAKEITLDDMTQTLGRIYKRMCPKPTTAGFEERYVVKTNDDRF